MNNIGSAVEATGVKDEEIRELVKERLKTFPSGKKLFVGSEGSFSKEEILKAIDSGAPIGDKFVEIQLNYLRALKEGLLVDA